MSDDLVKRLLANGLDECDEAADRIKELTAKLAEVEAERDEAAEEAGNFWLVLARAEAAEAREREAYKRGFRAALDRATEMWSGIKYTRGKAAHALRNYRDAIRAIPDSEGDGE